MGRGVQLSPIIPTSRTASQCGEDRSEKIASFAACRIALRRGLPRRKANPTIRGYASSFSPVNLIKINIQRLKLLTPPMPDPRT